MDAGLELTREPISSCEANAFNPTGDKRAHDALLVAVASYFNQTDGSKMDVKVRQTELPPIYLQHQGSRSYIPRVYYSRKHRLTPETLGHSLTIVGIELRTDGSANLLVFDPMFKTSPAMRRLIGGTARSPEPTRLLCAYRRGGAYLQKYRAFETLQLAT